MAGGNLSGARLTIAMEVASRGGCGFKSMLVFYCNGPVMVRDQSLMDYEFEGLIQILQLCVTIFGCCCHLCNNLSKIEQRCKTSSAVCMNKYIASCLYELAADQK